jgi:PAS domain S-box-containing protein
MITDAFDPEMILSTITESVILLDRAGRVVYFNKIAESFSELSPVHFRTGQSIYDMVEGENLEIMRFAIAEVLSSGSTFATGLPIRHPDGHTVFFEINLNPIVNEKKEVQYICLVSRDISPQKTFEKKSVQAAGELSKVIETANAIIFSVDAESYITEWNSECFRVSGYDKAAILGKRFTEFLSRDHSHLFHDFLNRILRGKNVSNVEFNITADNGSSTTLLLNGTPKTNTAGKVVGGLFVGQDITELSEYRVSLEHKVKDRTRKLKEALQKEKELVEIKNRFVSIASHEFRLPLNAISASLSVLRSTAGEASEDTVRTIEEHVQRMKSLLEDILSIERHESARLKPRFTIINLPHLLNNLIKEVGDASRHTHRFMTRYSNESFSIESDEKLLRNIFINLLGNAVKFSPGKDSVAVELKSLRDVVSVTVQDFGLGIPPEEHEKVFDSFVRGSNTSTIEGTGLGLSIARKAAETLAGSISVTSTPGKGSIFTVVLPNKPHLS